MSGQFFLHIKRLKKSENQNFQQFLLPIVENGTSQPYFTQPHTSICTTMVLLSGQISAGHGKICFSVAVLTNERWKSGRFVPEKPHLFEQKDLNDRS